MKKSTVLLLILFLIVAITGCAEATSQVSNTLEPQQTPTQNPTSTPIPTLSEEQIKNNNTYSEIFSYCKYYNDWSAAILIKDMYDEGKISEEQFNQIFSIDAFNKAKDFNDDLWGKIRDQINYFSEVINGKQNGLTEADVDSLSQYLSTATQQGTVYINLLDIEVKKERIKQGISIIDKWINEPNEANLDLLKESYFSEELTAGEIIFLNCYLYSNPKLPSKIKSKGKNVDTIEFLNKNKYMDFAETASNDLLNPQDNN